MPDQDATKEAENKKGKSRVPLILGVVAMLLLGGGGFFAVYSGAILSPASDSVAHASEEHETGEIGSNVTPLPDISFIPLNPIVVNIGTLDGGQHLSFKGQLEVYSKYESDVKKILPRVVSALNTYLRAVDTDLLESPAALIKARAHMLARARLAAGEDRIRDLLIMEFVIN